MCSYSRCSHDEAQDGVRSESCPSAIGTGTWFGVPALDRHNRRDRNRVGWARPRWPQAPWIGWNDSARSDTGGLIRIAVPGGRAGEVPQIPASRLRGPSVLRTRASARRPGVILRRRLDSFAQAALCLEVVRLKQLLLAL